MNAPFQKRVLLTALLLCSVIYSYASSPIRVACIGDSITYGSGIGDRDNDSYPAQLQKMLGDRYEVRNYGYAARVMVQTGDHPYMKEDMYAEMKAWLPEIVTIMLGTNDTKPQNWSQDQFNRDYDHMVRELKALPSHPEIFLCLPPRAFEDGKWGITDSLIVNGVIPVVKAVAAHHWFDVIDVRGAFEGHPELFSDGIHPNEAGAGVYASTVHAMLKDNGWGPVPGKKILFIGDSITDGDWGKADSKPSAQRSHYDYNHIYGHGYVEHVAADMLEKYPQRNYRFFNRGKGGDTLKGLAARWDDDVLAVRPDVVSILIGVNDTGGGQKLENFDFEAWEKLYREVIDRTLAADPGTTIVLCTPFITKRGAVGRRDDFELRRATLERMAVIVKGIAADYKLPCVDFARTIDDSLAGDRSGDRNYWTWDGVHPTMQAHVRLARQWTRIAGRYCR